MKLVHLIKEKEKILLESGKDESQAQSSWLSSEGQGLSCSEE